MVPGQPGTIWAFAQHVPGRLASHANKASTEFAIANVRLLHSMNALRCRLKQQFLDCAAGYDAACNLAYTHMRPILGRVVRRVAYQYNSACESEDLLQEVFGKLAEGSAELAATLPEEEFPLVAYLKILAANSARDWFRARGAKKRGFQITQSMDNLEHVVPHLFASEQTIERNLLFGQIEACLEGDEREVLIFRLHYRQGFTASEIARLPAVELSTKGVETALTRMRSRVRARLNPEGKSTGKSSS
jgi:RNA polymerase sigma-70 factor, ECF subfamily